MLATCILLYLVFTLGIGAWASRRIHSSQDFTLAGRRLSTGLVGVTIFATWYGPEFIMGVPGYFVEEGVMGTITDQFGTLLCLLLVAGFFARRLYAMGIVTLSDFFRIRFGERVETATSLIQVLSYFPWIAAQFVALAYLFGVVLGTSVPEGILLGATVVVIYTFIGGMWAVTLTDLLQSVLIVAGLGWVLVEVVGETDGILALVTDRPAGFYALLPAPNLAAWSDYLAMWMAFGLGAIPSQEIYQRLFSARSAEQGRGGVVLAGVLLFLIGCLPLVIGLAAVELQPELVAAGDGQSLIPNMVSRYTSLPVRILFFGALISAILSTSSGAMLSPATVIGENLIRPRWKGITDRQLLWWTRMSVVGVAAVACLFALNDSHIHGLVVDSAVLLMVCLLAPLTLGLHWKGATTNGAWAAIGLGAVTWFMTDRFDTVIDPTIYGTLASFAGMGAGSFLGRTA
ncbi:SSS family transporter [Neolewinella xylanilytica]|uniref:SSS family transporter n=1 Tax=Neolewinella xylanilytica TaxID=1514080 RepID=A0A2S6I209_9BACT|nr:sodium:solute symporter family protein [Neolewinella xylanilytica]PPK85208.1 SSS family transporter [Neolewinella xylanilytica]